MEMYQRSEDCHREDQNIRGGNGLTHIKVLATPDQMYGKARIFNHMTLDPGCSFGYHAHEHETEFYYILTGEAILNDNGTEVVLHTGDVSETGGGASHSLENRGDVPVELIALIINE